MADLSFKKEFQDTGIVTSIKAWCFGKDPIVAPQQIAFAAGANKFSCCAAYSMTCPKNEQFPELKVVFCAKLHSKIWHKDPANMSRWYLWQPIGKSGCLVLDSDKCEELYGFDFYKFYRTDVFRKGQLLFKKTLEKGIAEATPVADSVDPEQKNIYDEYMQSLKEATELVTQTPELNEKSFRLTDYDKFIEELKKKGYSDELNKRIAAKRSNDDRIGKRFMDRVKQNTLKPGEQERAIQHELKNQK